MMMMCLCIRPVMVEPHKPVLPLMHAQRLAGHLTTSKPARSSDKPAGRQAAPEVKTVTKPVSSVEKLMPAEPEELVTSPRPNAAGMTQVDDHELQQKKEAMRSVI